VEAARFETELQVSGARLHASGLSCSGLYGTWNVQLRVSGAATGSGSTVFTLEPGKEAAAPVSFGIHAGLISGRASGVLHVRGRVDALAVSGRITVKVPFKSVSRTIERDVPIDRGPDPGCGLSGGR
jgi:hypothetical protein